MNSKRNPIKEIQLLSSDREQFHATVEIPAGQFPTVIMHGAKAYIQTANSAEYVQVSVWYQPKQAERQNRLEVLA